MRFSPIQVALLPKSGEGVKVAALAKATGITAPEVTNELFDVWFNKHVDFDVRSDSYSRPATNNDLPTERKAA